MSPRYDHRLATWVFRAQRICESIGRGQWIEVLHYWYTLSFRDR